MEADQGFIEVLNITGQEIMKPVDEAFFTKARARIGKLNICFKNPVPVEDGGQIFSLIHSAKERSLKELSLILNFADITYIPEFLLVSKTLETIYMVSNLSISSKEKVSMPNLNSISLSNINCLTGSFEEVDTLITKIYDGSPLLKVVTLESWRKRGSTMPIRASFLKSASVEALNIKNFSLSIPIDDMYMPKLKNLTLDEVTVQHQESGEVTRRFFEAFSGVQNLSMNRWEVPDGGHLTVSNRSCQTLKLHAPNGNYMLSLLCPNLKSLSILDSARRGYYGGGMISLLKAQIGSYTNPSESRLISLIKLIYKAKALSFFGFSMEALLKDTHEIPVFANVKRLDLVSASDQGWKILPTLLYRTPYLRILSFPQGFNGDELSVNIDFSGPPVPSRVLYKGN